MTELTIQMRGIDTVFPYEKHISTLIILDVSFRQIMDMNMSDICHILGGDVKNLY